MLLSQGVSLDANSAEAASCTATRLLVQTTAHTPSHIAPVPWKVSCTLCDTVADLQLSRYVVAFESHDT